MTITQLPHGYLCRMRQVIWKNKQNNKKEIKIPGCRKTTCGVGSNRKWSAFGSSLIRLLMFEFRKNPKLDKGTVLPALIKQGKHLWKNDEDKLWKSKMKKIGRQSSGHETPIPSQRLSLFSIWSKALTTRLSSLKKGRGQTDGSAGVSLARLSSSAHPSGFVNFVVSSVLRRERWLLVRGLTGRRLRRKRERERLNKKKKRFEFLMLWRSEDCVPIKGNWST